MNEYFDLLRGGATNRLLSLRVTEFQGKREFYGNMCPILRKNTRKVCQYCHLSHDDHGGYHGKDKKNTVGDLCRAAFPVGGNLYRKRGCYYNDHQQRLEESHFSSFSWERRCWSMGIYWNRVTADA